MTIRTNLGLKLCERYPDAAGAEFAEAGLLESKGYFFPCQHLNHSRGASPNAFTVFYAAATALEGARMKHCCCINTCLNSYHYFQL